VVVAGENAERLARVLALRPGVRVRTVDEDLGGDPVECVVADAANGPGLTAMLSAHGYLILRMDESGSVRDEAARCLKEVGFVPYRMWPDTPDRSEPMSKTVDMLAVRAGYNPLEHAHALFREGAPERCYGVLKLIPPAYLADPDTAARVYADMQYCLAATIDSVTPEQRLARFFHAQAHFYRVVCRVPSFRDAYHTQAELWCAMGNADMGLRLLRTLQHLWPNDETAQLIETWPARPPRVAPAPEIVEWKPGDAKTRILMLLSPVQPHFLIDVIYDGLCAALGDDEVVEFPWKPTLHGQPAKSAGQYPCLFDRPGAALELEQVTEDLRRGRFDCVLFCDFDWGVNPNVYRQIFDAAGDTPVFLLDGQDDPKDNRVDFEAMFKRPVRGYFKREMLVCHDYGPGVYPMPFAYPENRIAGDIDGPRPEIVFWAGNRQCALRRPYIEHVERLLGVQFNAAYTPGEYLLALRRARIGINIFGMGYDTVRYWELPANGCMLLSERPPIHIPNDFRDGESAVFFGDAKELEEKVLYYATHPEEASAIAAAGYAHLKQHHTGAVRARQMLGWIGQTIGHRT
ncbi:MAG: hypothetical protein QG656_404, partial [Candidatus Hydrogenedentes bacterium]|nr:hypothetical protein [Candidatus Hydrogenedentota bacterium]